MDTTTKVCNHCGLDKALSRYGLLPRSADGHLGYCSDCNALQCRTRRDAPKDDMNIVTPNGLIGKITAYIDDDDGVLTHVKIMLENHRTIKLKVTTA